MILLRLPAPERLPFQPRNSQRILPRPVSPPTNRTGRPQHRAGCRVSAPLLRVEPAPWTRLDLPPNSARSQPKFRETARSIPGRRKAKSTSCVASSQPDFLPVPGFLPFPDPDVVPLADVIEPFLPHHVRNLPVHQQRGHRRRAVPFLLPLQRGHCAGATAAARVGSFGPSCRHERRRQLLPRADEHHVDQIRRLMGTVRRPLRQPVQRRQLFGGQGSRPDALIFTLARNRRLVQRQSHLDTRRVKNLRLRNFHDQRLHRPDSQLRVHVETGRHSDVACGAIRQAGGRALRVNVSVFADALPGIIDFDHARRNRNLGRIRQRHGIKFQFDFGRLVNNSQAHAPHRFHFSLDAATSRQTQDRSRQHRRDGRANLAGIAPDGGRQPDFQMRALPESRGPEAASSAPASRLENPF